MKWIGQHIWDSLSRFRNTVYLEDITESAQDHVVGIDSDGKLYKQDVATGDITGVTAGTGLDGGGTSGSVSLSVDVSDFMSNGSDNRILTATGTDAMNAEANFTFDGSTLGLTGVMGVSPANDAGAAALTITNTDVDQIALDIDTANTTANIIDINAQELTTGNVMFIDCNSLNGTSIIKIDADSTVTGNVTNSLVEWGYDKSGVTGSGNTQNIFGSVVNIRDLATNHSSGVVNMTGSTISLSSTSNQGTITNTGIDITVTGGDQNYGIDITTTDDERPDIIIKSSADSGDYCSITTNANGATTVATVDDDGTNANLTLDLDGTLFIDNAAGRTYYYTNGNTDDYLLVAVGSNGDTTLTTVDAAAAAAHFEIAADGNITLDATNNIALECGGGALTCDANQVTFSNSTSDSPIVQIKNTNTDNSGAELHFVKDKGDAGADGDEIGIIKFYGDDDGQNQTYYSHIKAAVVTAADGTEGGSLKLAVASHDGEIVNGLQIIDGNAEDELDVTIGNTATSVTTITGTLTMGSTAFVNNSGVIQVATQGTIDHDSLANFVANEHIDWTGSSAGTIHSSNIPTLNQDTTGVAAGLTASTSNSIGVGSIELGHANDTTIARSASGVATIEGKEISTREKVIHIEHSNFSDDIDTTEHFIPFVTTTEHTSFANVVTPMIMPVAGKLLKVHYKANNHTNSSSNEVTFRLYDLDDGELWTDGNKTVIGTKVVDGVNRVNMCTADFTDLTTTGASGTNAFTAGEMIGVSLQNSQDMGVTTKYSVTMVFELDFSSY